MVEHIEIRKQLRIIIYIYIYKDNKDFFKRKITLKTLRFFCYGFILNIYIQENPRIKNSRL